jgi:hypothetical protein
MCLLTIDLNKKGRKGWHDGTLIAGLFFVQDTPLLFLALRWLVEHGGGQVKPMRSKEITKCKKRKEFVQIYAT